MKFLLMCDSSNLYDMFNSICYNNMFFSLINKTNPKNLHLYFKDYHSSNILQHFNFILNSIVDSDSLNQDSLSKDYNLISNKFYSCNNVAAKFICKNEKGSNKMVDINHLISFKENCENNYDYGFHFRTKTKECFNKNIEFFFKIYNSSKSYYISYDNQLYNNVFNSIHNITYLEKKENCSDNRHKYIKELAWDLQNLSKSKVIYKTTGKLADLAFAFSKEKKIINLI